MSQTQAQGGTQLFGQDFWGGVCGFVSVIHALLLKRGGNALQGLSQAELEYNVGLSLLAFLKFIRSNKPVADEIVAFTQSFGGVHAKKTIETLIRECELKIAELTAPRATGLKKTGEDGWGIGMTKAALVAYINWLGLTCVERPGGMDWTQANLRPYRNCVVGVGNKLDKGGTYAGLRHWVYVNEAGVMYNWGKETPLGDTGDRPYPEFDQTHTYIVAVLEIRG